jgi:Transposase IS66 family
VPGVRRDGGSGASARAADQGRLANGGDGRVRAGLQLRLASAALPTGPDAGRQGIDIKRSVLAFWVGYAAAELRPVYERLRELILTSGKIAVDETKAPVLDPGPGRVKDGYFWVVACDDRPWGGRDPPAIAYVYAPGRGAINGLKLLDTYRGVVQCDGYAAYKTIAAKTPDDRITLAFAGRICGDGSSIRRRAPRRSPARRSRGSPSSMRPRRRSGA